MASPSRLGVKDGQGRDAGISSDPSGSSGSSTPKRVLSWFYLPPSPTQTASWFRGEKGWFTEREEAILVNRILRDDPSKARPSLRHLHGRKGAASPVVRLTLRLTGRHAQPPGHHPPAPRAGPRRLRPLAALPARPDAAAARHPHHELPDAQPARPRLRHLRDQLAHYARLRPLYGPAALLGPRLGAHRRPLRRRALLLGLAVPAVPHPARAACRRRRLGAVWRDGLDRGLPRRALDTTNSWSGLTSRNAGSVQTRTVGSAVYNMCVQGSSIMGSNIYRQDDAPLYNRGNTLILGIIAWNAFFTMLIKCYYIWRNRSRESIWNAMTSQQKDDYPATTTDQGSKRLDFRFAH